MQRKDVVTSAIEVVSAGSVAVGAGLWSLSAGLVTAGLFGLVFAWRVNA